MCGAAQFPLARPPQRISVSAEAIRVARSKQISGWESQNEGAFDKNACLLFLFTSNRVVNSRLRWRCSESYIARRCVWKSTSAVSAPANTPLKKTPFKGSSATCMNSLPGVCQPAQIFKNQVCQTMSGWHFFFLFHFFPLPEPQTQQQLHKRWRRQR